MELDVFTSVKINLILCTDVLTYTDSDSAGDAKTRVTYGERAHTRRRKIIARGGSEAELYAAALNASESNGIVSMISDLGFNVKLVLGA